MKTRILSMLVVVGGLALLPAAAAASQGAPTPPGPASPPAPPAVEFAPPYHIPYNPYQRLDTLPVYPYNDLRPAGALGPALLVKPEGVDLDVTTISRAPTYNRYEVWYTSDGKPYLRPGTENEQRWPAPGEVVTFTAYVMNKGTVASGSFAYKWSIDGVEVGSGVHDSLAPGEQATEAYEWTWAHTMDGERILGSHAVRFSADPGDLIPETYESNNSLEDRIDALSLILAVTPELYTALETPVDPSYPFSAEDWLQKQIAAMNAAFVCSAYPSAPSGILERVRLEKILVAYTSPPADLTVDGGFFMAADDRYGNAYYDPASDVSGALVHELSHQLGIIDTYNIGFPLEAPQVLDRGGLPVQMGTGLAVPGLMTNPGIVPLIYDEHTALAVNSNKGYRRGYYGEYLYDVSEQVSYRVLDNTGQPAAGVAIRLFQRSPGPEMYGSMTGTVDNTPEIEVTTAASGLAQLTNRPVGAGVVTHTGHVLRNNPFGVIDVVGGNDEFIIELTKGDHQEYGWVDITAFNLAYWRQGGQSAVLEIASHVPPDGAPPAPLALSGKLESGLVELQWDASGSADVVGYNVYRARAREADAYQRIASNITQTTYSSPYDDSAPAATYAVTAADAQGRESGFGDLFYALRLLNPTGIAVDEANNRIVLDPQNGYALLHQLGNGTFDDTRGSVHFHFELSQYLARDQQGRLIVSHPADYYSSRHSVRVIGDDFYPLLEFGERGSADGQFETPAGVAVWGQPCTIEGPLVVDPHTLLLLHFDGSYSGAQGEAGAASGTDFAAGRYAEGVLVDSNDMLTYATADNLNPTQGALEFWIRPNWPGSDGQSYTFFEAGDGWFNRMRIMKDGANNLRFMLWDSSAEYGVGYNVAAWNAGDWHHVAATWEGTHIALYVDSELRDENFVANPPDALAAELAIGASAVWGDQQANAVMDEFRISDIPRVGDSDTCGYRIIVADSGNHRILAFDAQGDFVTAFGGPGSDPDQFNNPQGLAADAAGRILVADSGNNRLQVLHFDGSAFTFEGGISAGLNGPIGVATYGSDRIIVADTGNSEVKVLDGTGVLLAQYAAPNDGYAGAFNRPRGVVADLSGNIVVADTGNRRVVTIRGALSETGIAVNALADETDVDGNCSLREAIQAANTDQFVDGCAAGHGADTIALPAGTYTLTLAGADEDGNATGDLDILSDLALVGASSSTTIIDGNQLDRVLQVHQGAAVQVSGVTIRNGLAPAGLSDIHGGGDAGDGGGIWNAGDLTLSACAIASNGTGDGGGAYDGSSGDGGDGGGIWNEGDLTLSACSVAGNRTGDGGNISLGTVGRGGQGGGIANSGQLTLTLGVLAENVTGNDGRVLWSGSLPDSLAAGGGIFNAGQLVMADSSVRANRVGDGVGCGAASDGGGIANRGRAKIVASVLSGNLAGPGGCPVGSGSHAVGTKGGDGGGISNQGASARLSLVNSTVSENQAGEGQSGPYSPGSGGDGGGIYNSAVLTASNVTIAGNLTGTVRGSIVAPASGGGIYNLGSVEVRNTILAGNKAGETASDCQDTLTSKGHNFVQSLAGCVLTGDLAGNITGLEPRLGPLTDNGGPTWTRALLLASPAVDAGSCSGLDDTPVTVDQRGVSRPQGPGCDMGAYEAAPFMHVYLPLLYR